MAEKKDLSVREKQELKHEETTRPGRTFVPEVDIFETRDGLWLWADMPGVDEKSLNVHLSGNVLTIEAQVATTEYENLKPAYAEYHVGNFMRRFTVGSDVDSTRIQARMRNGVLELEMPKAEAVKPRQIEVQIS